MAIRHIKHEKGTETEMRPAIVSGIIFGDETVSYWPIFSLSLVTVPKVFAKVNSVQFPSRSLSGEFAEFIGESKLGSKAKNNFGLFLGGIW